MIDILIKIILIALAVGAITFTICVTSIFAWLRELVSKIHPKIEELIHCPWCLSFWITILMLLQWSHNENYFIRVESIALIIISNHFIVNFLITVFAIMAISGLLHSILLVAYKPIAEMTAFRKIQKLKENGQKRSGQPEEN